MQLPFPFPARLSPARRRHHLPPLLLVLVLSLTTAAAPTLLQAPAQAATSDALDVVFSGSFSSGSSYTAAQGEAKEGALERLHGSETQGDFGTLSLPGGPTGARFVATSHTLAPEGGQDATGSFRAEMLVTPGTGEQVPLATWFSAGGNIFVRSQGGSLVYGFSSFDGSRWANHQATTTLPEPGRTHLLRVTYTGGPTQATMTVSVDGVVAEPVSAAVPARLGESLARTYGFGYEVNPAGQGRGLAGVLNRIRLAPASAPWVMTLPTSPGDQGDDGCDIGEITPGNHIAVSSADCAARIRAKASASRPTRAQADFLDAGLTAFLHFNINTFTGSEWGWGNEDPNLFQPTDLDTDQWARTLADAGFRYAILTVKHHDGFTLFPSRYTSHDVESSSWENGQGDVVRRFVDSAHRHNLKVGFYLSPADSYQERQHVYGNGSAKTERTIPTLVPGDTRAGRIGTPEYPGAFRYAASDYGALFLNTIYELMTQYGPVDEMWFDGANGNTAHTENYDFQAYFDLIHTLQPDTLIAVAGPDVRWVGNEGGLARSAEWSPQAVKAYDNGRLISVPSETASDLGSSASLVQQVRSGAATEIHWYPAEADVSLHDGWFWHDNQQPKSVSRLMDIYRRSYGRNSVLLLNIPPNKAGRIDERDITRLQEWTAARRAAFSDDAALGRPATITLGGQTLTDQTLTDGSSRTSAPAGATSGTWTVELGSTVNLSSVLLAEDTYAHGQQVESFTVELRHGGTWQSVAAAPTIGARRILSFPEQPADAVRVSVESARGPVHLSELRALRTGTVPVPSTLYVDTSAAVPGTGTAEAPISHLDQLQEMTLPAGTTLLFRRGTTLSGSLRMWGYGTADKPIRVGLYGQGADPVVSLEGVTATTLPQALEGLGLTQAGWQWAPDQPAATPSPSASPKAVPSATPTGGTEAPGAVKPAYVSAVEATGSALVLQGDWDGDGTQTFAVRTGCRVVFYNENRVDAPVYASVCLGRSSDQVLVGDWDGDGKDTLALRRGARVMTQDRLTSASTTLVAVEGLTASSRVTVRRGSPDTIVVE